MKAGEITDSTIEEANNRVMVEMPNGTKTNVSGYYHGHDDNGKPVLIICAGKEHKRAKK